MLSSPLSETGRGKGGGYGEETPAHPGVHFHTDSTQDSHIVVQYDDDDADDSDEIWNDVVGPINKDEERPAKNEDEERPAKTLVKTLVLLKAVARFGYFRRKSSRGSQGAFRGMVDEDGDPLNFDNRVDTSAMGVGEGGAANVRKVSRLRASETTMSFLEYETHLKLEAPLMKKTEEEDSNGGDAKELVGDLTVHGKKEAGGEGSGGFAGKVDSDCDPVGYDGDSEVGDEDVRDGANVASEDKENPASLALEPNDWLIKALSEKSGSHFNRVYACFFVLVVITALAFAVAMFSLPEWSVNTLLEVQKEDSENVSLSPTIDPTAMLAVPITSSVSPLETILPVWSELEESGEWMYGGPDDDTYGGSLVWGVGDELKDLDRADNAATPVVVGTEGRKRRHEDNMPSLSPSLTPLPPADGSALAIGDRTDADSTVVGDYKDENKSPLTLLLPVEGNLPDQFASSALAPDNGRRQRHRPT